MEAVEDGEQQSRQNWHGNGQEDWSYPVNPDPAHLKQGMAPDPHSVSTADWHRLGYHILKRHLETMPSIFPWGGWWIMSTVVQSVKHENVFVRNLIQNKCGIFERLHEKAVPWGSRLYLGGLWQ